MADERECQVGIPAFRKNSCSMEKQSKEPKPKTNKKQETKQTIGAN
jgi:hypothetical protein